LRLVLACCAALALASPRATGSAMSVDGELSPNSTSPAAPTSASAITI
jgi:hypothetical protein